MRAFKRPKIISMVCIIGFISVLLSFPAVFSPSVKKIGDFVPALYGFIVACNFMAYIGLWHMKQWGVQLFLFTFFVKTLFLMMINDLGIITITGIILSLIFSAILLRHYPKMDINL
jgi:hypothetical protein